MNRPKNMIRTGCMGVYCRWLLKYEKIQAGSFMAAKLLYAIAVSAVSAAALVGKYGMPAVSTIILSVMLFAAPDVFIALRRIRACAAAGKELAVLKKLIVLHGSIKPADFNDVLEVMICEASYYRPILEEIKNVTARNTVNNSDIYGRFMKQASNLSERLFFEKLCEAQNYSFDQAVRNIDYECRLERRERERNVRKRVEMIHLCGIMFTMAVILLLIVYLIAPWMGMLDMAGGIFR